MDFVFFAAILACHMLSIMVSYDIACQWMINLARRKASLPGTLPRADMSKIDGGVPVWHAGVHEPKCRMKNSLSYKTGCGRSDGEGIERNWSRLNPISYQTKEMGEGGRHDNLVDKVDYENTERNHSLSTQLFWL